MSTPAVTSNTPLIIPSSTAMTTHGTGPLPTTIPLSKRWIFQSPDDIKYATSRKKEIEGFMERNVLAPGT